MNAKENWLIAWSVVRSESIYLEIDCQGRYLPRLLKEVKKILPLAKKCKNAESDKLGYRKPPPRADFDDDVPF